MESQVLLYNDPSVLSLSKEKKLSLLVLVLLEIVFGTNSILYDKTVEYLVKTGLIDPDTQSSDFISARTELFNIIIKLNENLITSPTNLLSNSSTQLANLVTNPTTSSPINIYNKTFTEIEELGSGSFSTVYKSQHKFDSKLYAIKKIVITDNLLDLCMSIPNKLQPLDEVKMLSSLSHPHVIRYYSSWVDFDLNYILGSMLEYESDGADGSDEADRSGESRNLPVELGSPILFIQTELCDYTLREYIDTKMVSNSVEQKFNYWKQILQGIQYIHSQGIIHRDVKPSNIFFLNGIVKIGDFGLSKNINTFALQISQSVEIGCGHYRAPEIDTGSYTITIDLYSLGVILLEMLLVCSTKHQCIITIKSILEGSLPIELVNLSTHQYDKLITVLTSPNPEERNYYIQYLE